MENYDFVKKILGQIIPAGSEHIDEDRMQNLKEYIKLVDRLICDLADIRQYKERPEHSIKKIGERADRYLVELKEAI
jgi:hypothetical protein